MKLSFDNLDVNFECFDTFIQSNVDDVKTEFFGDPGQQHYKLLAYLSTLYNNSVIIDIGSHRGSSALALSYNNSNKIVSFDIQDKVINQQIKNKFNIEFKIADIFESFDTYKDLLLTAPIIFLDIDPHDGHLELKLYEYLRTCDYQGLLICDDIWHFETMRNNFWYKVHDDHKFDLTPYGHWSGTGLITFNKKFDIHKYLNNNWTLVTAYFNLTKCPDASNEIRARDQSYYLHNAKSTLALPYNLIIYCDAESYELIYEIRPEYLRPRTKYVICEFDELKFNIDDEKSFKDYREIIIQNRKTHPYHFDNRNTASYYLFCMARYIMLKEVTQLNPFESSHFAWINICIQRMGINNVKRLPEALSVNRDKFSTVYIDYIPKELIAKTAEYFLWGRCSMCSGFFTGNKHYMYEVCKLIIAKFLQYLDMGYGHADEQLYSPVYFENPGLFHHYYGDYQEMITNYVYSYDNPEKIVHHFIRNSYENKDYAKCDEACDFVFNSLKARKCKLNTEQLREFGNFSLMAKLYCL